MMIKGDAVEDTTVVVEEVEGVVDMVIDRFTSGVVPEGEKKVRSSLKQMMIPILVIEKSYTIETVTSTPEATTYHNN